MRLILYLRCFFIPICRWSVADYFFLFLHCLIVKIGILILLEDSVDGEKMCWFYIVTLHVIWKTGTNNPPTYHKYVSEKVLDNRSMCVEGYNLQEVNYIECTSGSVLILVILVFKARSNTYLIFNLVWNFNDLVHYN